MTRVVGDRVLKDSNGHISDHLHNHIHLTNCIHLKNHMHKHNSPILPNRSLMRDLGVLQRSRSLRDPSASPPSWHSPFVADLLSRRQEKDAMIVNGRRSVDIEPRRHGRRVSGSSPLLASLRRLERAPCEASGRNDGAALVSDRSSKSGVRIREPIRRNKRGELSQRDLDGRHEHLRGDNCLIHDDILENSGSNDNKMKQTWRHIEDAHIHVHCNHNQNEESGEEEAQGSTHGYCSSGLKRVQRRRFKGRRRSRTVKGSRDSGAQNDMSVASNTLLAQTSARPTYMEEEEEVYHGQNHVTRAPRNGCGIPWNWSRIHHRGKSILDMAGRSLACGLSESKLKKGGTIPQGRGVCDMLVTSDYSSSSKYDAEGEAMPLLVEASGSQEESTDNTGWMNDYSGELGIFADSNILKLEIDSDLASEARSGEQHKFRRHHNGSRHQSLTQKYMPRTFGDLVGQNLVVQALSNAVFQRKVGLLYVFYGPHGTGKTSCARIFARALNCQSVDQPKPCGLCNSCISHEMGKSRNIRELGPVTNVVFESIMDFLDNTIVSLLPSQYRVFIFDDCDTLSPDCWTAILKVIDRSPRGVVFVLVCSALDILPHLIVSRCQKFCFPKLKDSDIMCALQWITTKEDIEIDSDALKLIASRSDGSLRDAEMTLEQLSLFGQRISVPLVQELVGLISDEKLVDLLDLALSADTVNTVKNLREIMESGVEPLALMSQLATVITDILAGSYDLTKERPRRKFFQRQALLVEDMERLRQALKTLSEAEKQLRMSNDKLTWLTAAMLQLAPDQQYMLPSSSVDTSLNPSPLVRRNAGGRERLRKSDTEHAEIPNSEGRLSMNDTKIENLQAGSSSDAYRNDKVKGNNTTDRRRQNTVHGMVPQHAFTLSADMNRASGSPLTARVQKEIEEIWLEVLEKIQISSIKEFVYQEGKLISVSFGAAPTVQLMFSSQSTKFMAEKYKEHLLQAFESILGSPVTMELKCEFSGDTNAGLVGNNSMAMIRYNDINKWVSTERDGLIPAELLQSDSVGLGKSEIVEIDSRGEVKCNEREDNFTQYGGRDMGITQIGDSETSRRKSAMASFPEQNQSQSLVRSKVSLGHVIQKAEGNGWSKHKAISIAEKLEQENLKLEPRSRSLLCWKASRATHRKFSRLKIRTRKPQTLLRFISCGKCLSSKSPK